MDISLAPRGWEISKASAPGGSRDQAPCGGYGYLLGLHVLQDELWPSPREAPSFLGSHVLQDELWRSPKPRKPLNPKQN